MTCAAFFFVGSVSVRKIVRESHSLEVRTYVHSRIVSQQYTYKKESRSTRICFISVLVPGTSNLTVRWTFTRQNSPMDENFLTTSCEKIRSTGTYLHTLSGTYRTVYRWFRICARILVPPGWCQLCRTYRTYTRYHVCTACTSTVRMNTARRYCMKEALARTTPSKGKKTLLGVRRHDECGLLGPPRHQHTHTCHPALRSLLVQSFFKNRRKTRNLTRPWRGHQGWVGGDRRDNVPQRHCTVMITHRRSLWRRRRANLLQNQSNDRSLLVTTSRKKSRCRPRDRTEGRNRTTSMNLRLQHREL